MIGARRAIGLVLLGLLALGLRVWVALAFCGPETQPSQDSASQIAESLSGGRGFSWDGEGPTSREAPFYPLLLAAAYRCLGPATPQAVLIVQLLQCMAGAMLVPVVAWLAWSLVPERRSFGWLAAAMAAVYPPHLVSAGHLHVAVWVALTLTSLLAVAVSCRWRQTRRRAVVAGCLAGLLLLMEPMLLLVLPVCAVAFWWTEGGAGKMPAPPEAAFQARFAWAPARRLALMLGVAALIIAPWLVRNRLVHGRFLCIGANFRYVLWQGNRAACPDDADASAAAQTEIALLAAAGPGGTRLSELQRSELLGGRAYADICAHPARYGELCLTRLYHFLMLFDAPSSRPERIATVAWMMLALMGLGLSCGRWRSLWPTYAAFAVVVLFAVFVSSADRFRTAIEPMTLVWASAAVMPPLARLFPGRHIRVYRPGEAADELRGAQHVLQGPHYDVDIDVAVRRRAG